MKYQKNLTSLKAKMRKKAELKEIHGLDDSLILNSLYAKNIIMKVRLVTLWNYFGIKDWINK